MLVNGVAKEFLPGTDRGLAYGDGVFETILVHHQQPVLYTEHLARLLRGLDRLQIPLDLNTLEQEVAVLAPDFPQSGVLKIVVTRGSGGRGYRPTGTAGTTRVLSLHALPDYSNNEPAQGVRVFVCGQRLAIQPALAGIKHLNRLEQVLAALEWPRSNYMEGIMLDMEGYVVEGTRSNLFWVENETLMTTALENCGVKGVMREYLLQQTENCEIVADCTLPRLLAANEMFLCNSVFGIWPVKSVLSGSKETGIGQGQADAIFTKQAQECFNSLLTSYEN